MKKRNISMLLITFLGVFTLSSCDMSKFAEEINDQVITALIPNFWAFLTQFIALIVLIVIVGIFGYKPLKKFLDKRANYIQSEVSNAEKNNLASKDNLLNSEKNIAASKQEALEIVENAKTSAGKERLAILKKADEEANLIREQAKLEIIKEKEKAKKDVRDEIINVALEASEKVLQREVNKDDNKRILNDFVDTMGKESNK